MKHFVPQSDKDDKMDQVHIRFNKSLYLDTDPGVFRGVFFALLIIASVAVVASVSFWLFG